MSGMRTLCPKGGRRVRKADLCDVVPNIPRRTFFHAITGTFIANGGRLKFNLTGIKTGIEGATTWELRAILKKSSGLEAKTDFFLNGRQLTGAELEAALKPWRQ
jgi:hypothetical protein